jgi:hypothetical protein
MFFLSVATRHVGRERHDGIKETQEMQRQWQGHQQEELQAVPP